MTTKNRSALAAAALVASVSFAQAQGTQDHEAHHPMDQGAVQSQQPMGRGPGMPQGAMPTKPAGMGNGQGMMMGGDMAQMMSMMQMMRGGMMPMGMGPGGAQALRHIEGQIAFYKAELRITEAQGPQWNAFADAMRSSATRLRQAMAPEGGAAEVRAAPDQMERRITLLSAQLDAMRDVLAAAKPLYAVLSDEQKKTADDLMAEHFMTMRAGRL
jgi:LTXXQ motif family protein